MGRVLQYVAFVLAIAIGVAALLEIEHRNNEKQSAIATPAPLPSGLSSSTPPETAAPTENPAASSKPAATPRPTVTRPSTTQSLGPSPATPAATVTPPRTPTPPPPITPGPSTGAQRTPHTGGGAVGSGLAFVGFAVVAQFVRALRRRRTA